MPSGSFELFVHPEPISNFVFTKNDTRFAIAQFLPASALSALQRCRKDWYKDAKFWSPLWKVALSPDTFPDVSLFTIWHYRVFCKARAYSKLMCELGRKHLRVGLPCDEHQYFEETESWCDSYQRFDDVPHCISCDDFPDFLCTDYPYDVDRFSEYWFYFHVSRESNAQPPESSVLYCNFVNQVRLLIVRESHPPWSYGLDHRLTFSPSIDFGQDFFTTERMTNIFHIRATLTAVRKKDGETRLMGYFDEKYGLGEGSTECPVKLHGPVYSRLRLGLVRMCIKPDDDGRPVVEVGQGTYGPTFLDYEQWNARIWNVNYPADDPREWHPPPRPGA